MALTEAQAINKGIPFTAIVQSTGTGRTFSQYFTLIPYGGIPYVEAVIKKNITSGAITAFLVDLECSSDGGTTWDIIDSFDLVAVKAQRVSLMAGLIYRFNITTFTGSTTPIADVTVSL